MTAAKVLVIEDDQFLADLYANQIGDYGFQILRAPDGLEGLRLIDQEKPNLILLDMVLPKISGMELLKKIKGEPSTQNIPLIILTNVKDSQIVEEAKALGVTDYFVKTMVTPSFIAAEIRRILKGSP